MKKSNLLHRNLSRTILKPNSNYLNFKNSSRIRLTKTR